VVRNWPASNPVWSGHKVKSFKGKLIEQGCDPDPSSPFNADPEPTFHFNADTDPDSAPHLIDEDQLHFAHPDLAFTVMRTRFQHPKINPDPFGSGSAVLVLYMNVCTLYCYLQVRYSMLLSNKECIDLRGDLVQYAFIHLT
jgi:hypothetical protein